MQYIYLNFFSSISAEEIIKDALSSARYPAGYS